MVQQQKNKYGPWTKRQYERRTEVLYSKGFTRREAGWHAKSPHKLNSKVFRQEFKMRVEDLEDLRMEQPDYTQKQITEHFNEILDFEHPTDERYP